MTIRTDTDRPGIQIDGSTIYLRASMLGKCVRAIAADILKYDRMIDRPELIKAAEAGHRYERHMEAVLAEQTKMSLKVSQVPVKLEFEIDGRRWVVTGHAEGLWYYQDIPMYMWENKSMSPNQYDLWIKSLERDAAGAWVPTFRNHPHYAWSISVYMHSIKYPCLYTAVQRAQHEDGTDNKEEWIQARLMEPPYALADIRARIQEVSDIISRPLAVEDPSYCSPDANRWFCPYRDTMNCMDAKEPKRDVEMYDDPEFEKALIQHVALKAKIKDLEKDLAAARAVIEEHVPKGSVETPTGYRMYYQAGRQSTDLEAVEKFLKEHGKRLQDFKKKGKHSLYTKGPKG